MNMLIESYLIKFMCDCGGEMFFTGKTLLSDPLLYQHQCDKCKMIEDLDIVYPYISVD